MGGRFLGAINEQNINEGDLPQGHKTTSFLAQECWSAERRRGIKPAVLLVLADAFNY